MKIPKVNIIFRTFDFLLWPFMFILGKFTFPLQETHKWHVQLWDWSSQKGLIVKEKDAKARFGHDVGWGLFHMPIIGGLTKYVVVEAKGFNNYWNVGWPGQIHLLPIKENRLKLLVGKRGFIAYGLGDNRNILKLKIVGFGELGDKRYEGLRLF